jgi:hypothetical protein
MTPVSGRGYRVGNVLEFEATLFGGGSSGLMVTITGIAPVRKPLPLRLLSNYGAVLVAGVAISDVWAEFTLNSTASPVAPFTLHPSPLFSSVAPRVPSSACSSRLPPLLLTQLANKAIGPSMSRSTFSSCRRVCGTANAVTGSAALASSGDNRCGAPVFSIGDTATILCSEGHWLSVGTHERLCQSDYSFSSSAVCSPLSCPTLVAPAHGSLLPAPYWQGKFACDTHWRLSGSHVLTCLSSGQWDQPAPTCVRVTCFPSLSPRYGRVVVRPSLNFSDGNMTEYAASYTQATQAIQSASLLVVSCDLGFDLVGHRSVLCNASGAYNATLGSCVPVPCLPFATLMLPPRVIVVPASIRYLDTAVVTCESGYRFENGSAEITAWCDVYGNVSTAAHVPLCFRIPNFCEVHVFLHFQHISLGSTPNNVFSKPPGRVLSSSAGHSHWQLRLPCGSSSYRAS